MTTILEAVCDPEVQAAVQEATIEQIIAAPAPDEEGHDPLISDTTISRAVEPADYVAAIHDHIDKFDGLQASAVTEAAVAAVLPQEEES